MLGLYLHVPFCQAICTYCNFNRGLFDPDLKPQYVRALAGEVRAAGDGRPADTIFFGGGTPSLLDAPEIAALLEACRASYALTADAEVTLEVNPETVTAARLAAYRQAGVTRLSFGAQTFDDEQLRRLGRIHSAARIGEAIRAARTAGVDNVSLDLMFWLPGQTRASWLASIDAAIALAPDHLSLYLLELYPNAPLKEAMARQPLAAAPEWAQVADDEAADMYLEGLARLDAAGFEQYEISNVARDGRVCRHNLKYWSGGDWRGFGCGAHSTVEGQRWKNVGSTVDYIERLRTGTSVATDVRTLDRQERAGEALFTGLRLTAGVDRQGFAAAHGRDPWEQYGGELASAVEAGFVWVTPAAFGLTRTGMLVSNEILQVVI